jgi:hypothetical protein
MLANGKYEVFYLTIVNLIFLRMYQILLEEKIVVNVERGCQVHQELSLLRLLNTPRYFAEQLYEYDRPVLKMVGIEARYDLDR